MPNWKEGDRARVVKRPVTDEDRKKNRYFDHMAGLVGTIQNVYPTHDVALNVDLPSMTPVSAEVHTMATQRMRDRFAKDTSEEQKKQLTKEDLEFTANYVVLVQVSDLEAE
jgi:hypothetical protein